ncbi:class I SAM-dependent methyltransferase [Kitasatospora sp. NPDC058190]|uniref:class I SAM-dependent methyltransferase n=1 Tax=Kitasatospora sp. NPDC058190 TaxID=3346371 RepID=UPI0036DF3B2E
MVERIFTLDDVTGAQTSCRCLSCRLGAVFAGHLRALRTDFPGPVTVPGHHEAEPRTTAVPHLRAVRLGKELVDVVLWEQIRPNQLAAWLPPAETQARVPQMAVRVPLLVSIRQAIRTGSFTPSGRAGADLAAGRYPSFRFLVEHWHHLEKEFTMTASSSDFATVGGAYAAYSSGGRGRLRHDITVRRVLAELGNRPARVLDVGCGDGEMVLRLAAAGHQVVGVEKSSGMLAAAAWRVTAVPGIAERVTLIEGDIYTLLFEDASFDAVVCHGVVMYLPDSAAPFAHLTRLVADGGILSVLTKNQLAVGVREAMTGLYASARAQIESGQAASVGNLGITTRGDTPAHLDDLARANGLTPLPWQGVRIFHDHRTDWTSTETEYQEALETEWAASTRSPYRELGRLVHAVARREAAA